MRETSTTPARLSKSFMGLYAPLILRTATSSRNAASAPPSISGACGWLHAALANSTAEPVKSAAFVMKSSNVIFAFLA